LYNGPLSGGGATAQNFCRYRFAAGAMCGSYKYRMKIAVYGDSYASDHPNPQRASWVQRLRALHPDWCIDNYAESGSSLYFTWQAWRDTWTDYDQHIVLVTQWDRWAIPHKDGGFQHLNNPLILKSTLDSESWLARMPGWTSQAREELTALWNFWTKVNTDDQRRDMHKLMLKDMMTSCPMPCSCPALPVVMAV